MDVRPILFFDSGVGGLSIVGPARAALPDAPFVYAADSAGFPYGTKSEAEIAARVPVLLGRLAERYRPRLIVIACNTASTIALPVVATVRQAYVDDLAARFAGDCTVLRHGSAALVEIAEARLHGHAVAAKRYAAVLDGLFAQPGGARIDVIVNACTHFPLVATELAAAAAARGQGGVRFVDGGPGIARRIVDLMRGQDWPGAGSGTAVFTRLGPDERALAPALAGYGFATLDQL